MKKFKLEISTPCHEDLDKMQPNAQGFYCSQCAKNVIDLSQKSNREIEQFVSKLKDTTNICARLKTTQMQHDFNYNTHEPKSNFKYAAAIATSVLLTTSVVGQEKPVVQTEQTATILPYTWKGEISVIETATPETTTFKFKGKLLDATTGKPLSAKEYPNMMIYVNGQADKAASKVNPKTGAFEMEVYTSKDRKVIGIAIQTADGKHYLKEFPFDIKMIKNKSFKKNIKIDLKEFYRIEKPGGMGIIFYDDKDVKC